MLNEFVAVATRKLAMSWAEIHETLTSPLVCLVEPLTVETHDRARLIAERYGFHFYDALIVAAALLSGLSCFTRRSCNRGNRSTHN